VIVSEQWLREWIDLDLDTAGLVERLTMSGLEVDSVTRAGPELTDVLVGCIVRAERHPSADRLLACDVDVGRSETLRIVCGAENARAGLRVAVALPGSRLPDGTQIRQTRIRDVESQGMLCSARELGLEEDSEGILELDESLRPGQALDEALAFDDPLIDIDMTPNRGDCLSILGLARELSILTGARLRKKDVPGVSAVTGSRPRIELLAKDACPRYVGRRIDAIEPGARTPSWMAERLRRCGLRPLDPVVDVTNYVMLELGQPMHAFDAHKIHNGIRVRRAKEGESLELLDGSRLDLDAETLVIADHSGAVALAGIMGGEDSAISGDTSDIIFEAAHFKPQIVAGRARRFGMQTDSSFRFERGVDPMMPPVACHYATHLITRIAGGRPGPVVDQRLVKHLPKRAPVAVRHSQATRLLGTEVPKRAAREILNRIGSRVTETGRGWRVTPPSHRFDLERECDFIEELARVRGYETIPTHLPSMPATASVGSESDVAPAAVKQVLIERGYREAITYSFVDGEVQSKVLPGSGHIRLANPLSDKMEVMRNSLWPGLLQAAVANLNRQHSRIRLFEVGKVFQTDGARLKETPSIGGLTTGSVYPVQWGVKTRETDFFDAKSDVEALLSLSGRSREFSFEPDDGDPFHPGQAAHIRLNGRAVGRLGMLHPALQRQFDLATPLFLFELDLAVIRRRKLPAYRGVSRFPAIRRDLSLSVVGDQPVADLVASVRETAGDLLVNVEVFDLYQPRTETSSTKSVGIGLTLQDSSRTLKDQEVEAVIKKVLHVLDQRFGAKLRT